MIRLGDPKEPVATQPSERKMEGLESAPKHFDRRIGTLSFPVRGAPHYESVCDNTALIVEVTRARHPALMLCAGWSVPTKRHLSPIIDATREVVTTVLLETTSPTPVYFRVAHGRAFKMGEQCFSTRKDTKEGPGPRQLADALPDRTFAFHERDAILLNCGEVMVVHGRKNVTFHWSVPQVLQVAVRAQGVTIFNPTHTRMANDGTIKAWREHLSGQGRLYVSASNWDVANGQRQSATLHSLWYNSKAASPAYVFENSGVCYREWDMP
jgi:hypothetical protein